MLWAGGDMEAVGEVWRGAPQHSRWVAAGGGESGAHARGLGRGTGLGACKPRDRGGNRVHALHIRGWGLSLYS